jgi:EpsI family protein
LFSTLAVFWVSFAGVITTLVDQWAGNALFSHGFAVPVISAYVAWTKSSELRRLTWQPDYRLGTPVLLAGALTLAIGKIGGIVALQGISLVLSVAGLTLLWLGREAFRVLRFPIVYLLLMVPLFYPLNWLQEPSQELSASIASRLLNLFGFSALQEGISIVLPSVTLEVMRECSGVNQLIALITMVLPAAHLWLRGWTRRVGLVIVSVIVAYLSNGVRIALLGILATKGLSDGNLRGPLHLLEGLAISLAGYLVIGGCLSVLARAKQPATPSLDVPQATATAAPSTWRSGRWPVLDYALVVVMLAAGCSEWITAHEIKLTSELSLPNQIGDWTVEPAFRSLPTRFPGIEDSLVGAYPSPTGERRFVAVDDQLLREYRNSQGQLIRVYVGYYRRQEQGKELADDAGHALHSAASDLSLPLPTETIELKEVVHRKSGKQRGLLFWYDINGRIVSDLYLAKGYTLWNGFVRRRTNGAVVMIAWDGVGSTATLARVEAISFARALMPILRQQLPS